MNQNISFIHEPNAPFTVAYWCFIVIDRKQSLKYTGAKDVRNNTGVVVYIYDSIVELSWHNSQLLPMKWNVLSDRFNDNLWHKYEYSSELEKS